MLYECDGCDFKTIGRQGMKKHLLILNPCMERDLSTDLKLYEYIESLITERKKQNLSNLTEEEKKEKHREQTMTFLKKNGKLGGKDINQFASGLLRHMNFGAEKRGHDISRWTTEDIIRILENNKIYNVHNTILGTIQFPLMLTNGYHNTATFDRINDNLGYSINNVEIRPHFLNTTYKLTTDDIRNVIKLRQEIRNEQELIDIAKYINNYDSHSAFYRLANDGQRSDRKHSTNEFDTIRKYGLFFVKTFIEQGGRCVYLNIPIFPYLKHKYKMSKERKNPLIGYTKENTILIVVGLNGKPAGQFLSEHLTDEEREIALRAGIFNQEYWDECTKMTPEIAKKCEEVRQLDRKILIENLSEKMKQLLEI